MATQLGRVVHASTAEGRGAGTGGGCLPGPGAGTKGEDRERGSRARIERSSGWLADAPIRMRKDTAVYASAQLEVGAIRGISLGVR